MNNILKYVLIKGDIEALKETVKQQYKEYKKATRLEAIKRVKKSKNKRPRPQNSDLSGNVNILGEDVFARGNQNKRPRT